MWRVRRLKRRMCVWRACAMSGAVQRSRIGCFAVSRHRGPIVGEHGDNFYIYWRAAGLFWRLRVIEIHSH